MKLLRVFIAGVILASCEKTPEPTKPKVYAFSPKQPASRPAVTPRPYIPAPSPTPIQVRTNVVAKSRTEQHGPQVDRWNSARINPKSSIALDVAVKLFERNEKRYQFIEGMKPNGVPAPVLFCLHYRESDNNFRCHAHEGSPLTHRTRDEPKNRLPHPDPPFTFEQSAFDAYYVCEHPPLDRIDWSNLQASLDKMESFNGFGYRSRGIAPPYLYSGTNLYQRGKFIADHRFSSTAVDGQLGCVAILLRMRERGIPIKFAP